MMMYALCLICSLVIPQTPDSELRPGVNVMRIWAEAPHSAFTDLLRAGDRLYCTFREGDAHVHGADGRIRVIARDAGGSWRSVVLMQEDGVDLRDPKLCAMPDGTVMLLCGGSVYVDRELVERRTRVAFLRPGEEEFGTLAPIAIDPAVGGDRDWLWRVTWCGGVGYGVVYQPTGDEWGIHLVSTRDGLSYKHVSTFKIHGKPNETTLRAARDGRMVALVRREAGDQRGRLGLAEPPFETWAFIELPVRLGGPNLLLLSSGEWIAASRSYRASGAVTILAHLGLDGSWRELMALPSGGDTSYPGLVEAGGELLVSYYSSHEGKTSIYLATLDLKTVLSAPEPERPGR